MELDLERDARRTSGDAVKNGKIKLNSGGNTPDCSIAGGKESSPLTRPDRKLALLVL